MGVVAWTAILMAAAPAASAFGYLVDDAADTSGPSRWSITNYEWRSSIGEDSAQHVLRIQIFNHSDAPIELEWMVPIVKGYKGDSMAVKSGDTRYPSKVMRDALLWDQFKRDKSLMGDASMLACSDRPQIRFSNLSVRAKSSKTFVLLFTSNIVSQHEGARLEIPIALASLRQETSPNRSVTVLFQGVLQARCIYSPDVKLARKALGRGTTEVTVASWPHDDRRSVRVLWTRSAVPLAMSLHTTWPKGEAAGYFALLGDRASLQTTAMQDDDHDVILVLDASSSLRGPGFERARRAAVKFVQQAPETCGINVILFSKQVRAAWPSPRLMTTEHRESLLRFLRRQQTDRGSQIDASLHMALVHVAEGAPRRQTVVLVTDGRPADSASSLESVVPMIRRARVDTGLRIFAMGVGLDVDGSWLDAIAHASGGDATYAPDASTLDDDLSALLRRVMRYTTHDVRVVLDELEPIDIILPKAHSSKGLAVLAVGRYARGGRREVQVTLGHGRNAKSMHAILSARVRGEEASDEIATRLWAHGHAARVIDLLRKGTPTSTRANARPGPQARSIPVDESRRNDRAIGERNRMVDELLDLAMRFGIITEPTAFLERRRDMDHTAREQIRKAVHDHFDEVIRSPVGRVGWMTAAGNAQRWRMPLTSPPSIWVRDDPGRRVRKEPVVSVRRTGGRTYFLRTLEWVDAQISPLDRIAEIVDRSSDHFFTIVRKATPEERQRLLFPGRALIELNGRRIRVQSAR